VASSANKIEIKDAVEKRFDVKVLKVATMNRLGKSKQMTVRSGGRTIRTSGHRSDWKKAIITLKEGSVIDLISGDVG
jgi:large subunit ribosomal protein L23